MSASNDHGHTDQTREPSRDDTDPKALAKRIEDVKEHLPPNAEETENETGGEDSHSNTGAFGLSLSARNILAVVIALFSGLVGTILGVFATASYTGFSDLIKWGFNAKFDTVNTRISGISDEFVEYRKESESLRKALDSFVAETDERFEVKLSPVTARLGDIEAGLQGLSNDVASTQKSVDDGATANDNRFSAIEKKLDDLSQDVSKVLKIINVAEVPSDDGVIVVAD